MRERAALLPQAPIYGIGVLDSTTEPFEIGWADHARDIDWAREILERSGIGRGDLVLLTTPNWEGPWSAAFAAALRDIGATYTTAETYNWDARRVAVLLRRLPVKAIFGLGRETLETLADSPTPFEELTSEVETIWAHPDAIPLLSRVTSTVLPFVKLGPAVGFGVPGVVGALVDPSQWSITEGPDGVMVSTVGDRRTVFTNLETGIHGRVHAGDGDQRIVVRR